MELNIKRGETLECFTITQKVTTLLEALIHIQEHIDPTLGFDFGCRSGVCGACSVRVNGKEQLACAYPLADGDIVEPLNYYPVKKDLLVDKSHNKALLKRANAAITTYNPATLTPIDETKSKVQTDCILCSSCYSACPVVSVNKEFLGPFALTQAYRYSTDAREANNKNIIDTIQQNAIWDCTLCNECTLACPMGIDPKTDIVNLRNLSAQYGYMDPNFNTMGFGSFDGGLSF